MITRDISNQIVQYLDENSAVAVSGPCQVGKTDLAHHISDLQPSTYFNLYNTIELNRISFDLIDHCDLHADKLIILDDVHKYPDFFNKLRDFINKRRSSGKDSSRILVFATTTKSLHNQCTDSKLNNIKFLELTGLKISEFDKPAEQNIIDLWVRGGYPKSYLNSSDQKSFEWRIHYLISYMSGYGDEFFSNLPRTTLKELWTLLACYHGLPVNSARIASHMYMSQKSILRYIDILEDLMVVRKLTPWSGSVYKQLVTSPRIYFRDSGILHAVLRLSNYDRIHGNQFQGKSWEGFVIEQIISHLSYGVKPYYYRTVHGAEINLLLEFGNNDYWAIDIKSGRSTRVSKGFHNACRDLNVNKKFVIYTGDASYTNCEGTTYLTVSQFIEKFL